MRRLRRGLRGDGLGRQALLAKQTVHKAREAWPSGADFSAEVAGRRGRGVTHPTITLDDLAHRLGGEVSGLQVLAPGPGHNDYDRSLAVRPADGWPGFIVHSFAGDDWRTCRDWVIDALGFDAGEIVRPDQPQPSVEERIARAARVWNDGVDPRGTLVERYLESRCIRLPDSAAGRVLRFHPACPWRDDDGVFRRVPAMVAAMGSLDTRDLKSVHRTRLSPNGEKLGRKMYGPSKRTAIPLEVLGDATSLVIGEGIETCLSGSLLGFRPVWALGSSTAIANFPVLHGVTDLTILAEMDVASQIAVERCKARWRDAGRNVSIVLPIVGKDMNDSLRELRHVGS